jgi:hypothetical protein
VWAGVVPYRTVTQEPDESTALTRTLAKAAAYMRAKFDKSAEIEHRGEKGTVREKIVVAEFLQDYLPGTVEVTGSSEIIDVNGARSPQNDIVIFDPSAPPLYRESDFRIIPSECVYGVIEVKSNLDNAELKASITQKLEL